MFTVAGSDDSHSTTELFYKYELIEDEIATFLESEKEESKTYM